MCMKLGPCESLLPKLQAVGTPRDVVDLFECSISEGDMAEEDIFELIIDDDDDDNIIDVEGWFDSFYFTNSKKVFINGFYYKIFIIPLSQFSPPHLQAPL